MEKHAYLIMAHHKFDILKELLTDLDHPDNDIFLHVDIKAKNYKGDSIKKIIHHAKLYLVERMNIHWGGFSQIQCIINLLKFARATENHSYYHFMVGVEFPLYSQEYIHHFFDEHKGYEFVGFDNADKNYLERVKYFHIFNEYARNNNLFQKGLNKIRIGGIWIQRFCHIDLTKKYTFEFKKGNANWSITQNLVDYIINNEDIINKIYRHSFCGDEVFIHTLIFNSQFKEKIFDLNDEYHSSMRTMTWKNPKNQYHLSDLNYLIGCQRLFARKIDGEDALELINALKTARLF